MRLGREWKERNDPLTDRTTDGLRIGSEKSKTVVLYTAAQKVVSVRALQHTYLTAIDQEHQPPTPSYIVHRSSPRERTQGNGAPHNTLSRGSGRVSVMVI